MKEVRDRPSWEQYFLNIAKEVATRSNCCRRAVGAVIVCDKRIVSTGYNGTPRGITNCCDGGCPRCNSDGKCGEGLGECLCSHAEENAIVQAAYHGVAVRGGVMYCTLQPCLQCAKMTINAGIKEFVYLDKYPNQDVIKPGRDILQEAGVMYRHGVL